MKIKVGDLVYVTEHQSSGIVIDMCIIKETHTIDDIWNTRMLVQEIIYKVLLKGHVVKLVHSSLKKI